MQPNDLHDKRILISPLNWGMGHVSRCVGLIDELIQQNNEVVIASNESQKAVFQYYFPNLTYVDHEGYPFRFSGKGNFGWDLATTMGALKRRLKRELKEVDQLIKNFQIDIIISDHRYGFVSDLVPSFFITHQYNLPVSRLQKSADRWHKKHMRPFSFIWLMDYEDSRLSGKLSAGVEDGRAYFIGPYTRFTHYKDVLDKTIETVVVVSGPDVYAQQFAHTMSKKFPNAVFICPDHIELDSRLNKVTGDWKDQDAVIRQAKRLVSRSGYSTFMDLEVLKIPALLYPTPGQVEQIYLHDRLTDCSEYSP